MVPENRHAAEPSLKRILAVLCLVLAACHPALTAVAVLPSLEYVPANKSAWLLCMAVLLAAALAMTARRQSDGGIWLAVLPLLAASVLRLFVGNEGMGPWQCALALLCLILGGVLFARVRAGKGIKRAVGFFSALILALALLLMALTALTGDGITLRSYPSPSGKHRAEVRIADGGATGGTTTVTVPARS